MSVTQTLTVTETGTDAENNISAVRIIWKSTQSGDSHNDYTRTAKYYVSINGGAETEYSVSYTLPRNSTAIIVDTTIGVKHRDDGTGSITVRTWMNTEIHAGVVEKSENLSLTTLPRASTIGNISGRMLGENFGVRWIPYHKSFTYKLTFAINSWKYTTKEISPTTTSAYTHQEVLPLDVAKQIPNSKTGEMNVSLQTLYNGNPIGTDMKSFTIEVPENSDTKPYLSQLTIGDRELFIQGRDVITAKGTARAQYGASIKRIELSAEGKTSGGNTTTTDSFVNFGWMNGILLTGYGNVSVRITLTDSRGFINSATQTIYVCPYSPPRVVSVSGEKNVVCGRCDANGNWDDAGTYLKIKARRSYSLCMANGVQNNFCGLRYRYKSASATDYSEWISLLDNNNLSTEEVITSPLLNGSLSASKSYLVQIDAVDTLGKDYYMTFDIPTDTVYLHKAGSKRSLGVGEYAEYSNTISIAKDMAVRLKSSINGVRMQTKTVSGTNILDIDTKYADFSGTGNERQSFFIFGEANGRTVYGVARVANNGTTLWGGSSGVTLSTKTGGVLSVTLPTTAYDLFTIISGAEFSL